VKGHFCGRTNETRVVRSKTMLVLAIIFLMPSLAVIGYASYIRSVTFAQYFEPIVLEEAWTSDLQRRRLIRVLTIELIAAAVGPVEAGRARGRVVITMERSDT
jgi:hypothetical protein